MIVDFLCCELPMTSIAFDYLVPVTIALGLGVLVKSSVLQAFDAARIPENGVANAFKEPTSQRHVLCAVGNGLDEVGFAEHLV